VAQFLRQPAHRPVRSSDSRLSPRARRGAARIRSVAGGQTDAGVRRCANPRSRSPSCIRPGP
jgi:hypothetical protein